jgi:hypothetical protein
LSLALTFSACTKKDDNINAVPVVPETQITINMKHMVGNSLIDFDNIQYTNAFGNLYSVATLKYFVSDFRFFKADGNSIYVDQEFYVDALEENTTSFVLNTTLPADDYTTVSFVFGLNTTKNITGAFPNPPENAMEWPQPMGGGYHYMKLEGKIDSSGTINNYQAHTGATMGNANFINVIIPISFSTMDKEEMNMNIIMDINKWWTSPNLLDLNEVTMIMGNQEMQEKLKANGQDVFSIGSIN